MQVTIPDELRRFLDDGDQTTDAVLTYYAVLGLYQSGRISGGKAAELLGLPKWDFLEQAAAAGVPYFRYAPGELAREVESLRRLDETVG